MGRPVIPIVSLPPVMPACWDKQQDWVAWCLRNKQAGPVQGNSEKYAHFCTDCTAKYQKEMVEQGRCAYPNTQFVRAKGTTNTFFGRRR